MLSAVLASGQVLGKEVLSPLLAETCRSASEVQRAVLVPSLSHALKPFALCGELTFLPRSPVRVEPHGAGRNQEAA